jgi:hypothetical protein
LVYRREDGGVYFEWMERREVEVGDFGGRRWLVEVHPGVVRVRVPVPATFPACPVLVLFDVVD